MTYARSHESDKKRAARKKLRHQVLADVKPHTSRYPIGCGTKKTIVRDSRRAHGRMYRRHECLTCGKFHDTVELSVEALQSLLEPTEVIQDAVRMTTLKSIVKAIEVEIDQASGAIQ